MLPTIADIGENGLIELVRSRIPSRWASDARVRLGIGDDAAVLATGANTVVCTDAVVEGVHFRHQWSSGVDVGVKLAARNFIDVAVMGAQASALVISLTAPADTEVAWLTDFIDGVVLECGRAGAVLVGGDTTQGWGLVVSATALGDVHDASVVTRSGARAGEVVAIAGLPGRAAAGLAALTAGRADDVDAELIQTHTRPQPDYAAAHRAAKAGATAMIDTSDGLLVDLGHLAHASAVAIELNTVALPYDSALVAAAATLNADVRTWQLTGGEDHCVLATFRDDVDLPEGFHAIGTVAAGVAQVRVDGQEWTGSGGYEHFR